MESVKLLSAFAKKKEEVIERFSPKKSYWTLIFNLQASSEKYSFSVQSS